jgi:carbonic anhydrase
MDLVDLLFFLMMFSLSPLVSAHPLFYPSSLSSAPAQGVTEEHSKATNGSALTLESLFAGNQRFRESRKSKVAIRSPEHTEETEAAPSFMFLGCSEHRFTPHRIFDAPEGSFFMHNTIANHYEVGDDSAEASLAFAAESIHVHHIIVLGHYGCKGVETAITIPGKASKFIKGWIQPTADLYRRHRRKEIVILRDSRMPQRGKPHGITDPPPSNDPGLRALVEENVKLSVTALKSNAMVSAMYSESRRNPGKTKDIFVHGFVHDETTGDVIDLGVSFGPPGKEIPRIPFSHHKRTENFHRSKGGIKKGKDWDFGKKQ